MYPSGELTELAARKSILQARIAVRRWECAAAATELARPLAIVDRAVNAWHRIAPFLKLLAIPGGLLFARALKGRAVGRKTKKPGKLAAIMAALPLVMRVAKMVMDLRGRSHGGRAASAASVRRPASRVG
jgi:hypothetical protein